MSRRTNVLAAAEDTFGARFLFYDRKESESVPVFAIEDAIIAGEVSIEELCDLLRHQLSRSVSRRRENPEGTYP